jgi:hypothetical protein
MRPRAVVDVGVDEEDDADDDSTAAFDGVGITGLLVDDDDDGGDTANSAGDGDDIEVSSITTI